MKKLTARRIGRLRRRIRRYDVWFSDPRRPYGVFEVHTPVCSSLPEKWTKPTLVYGLSIYDAMHRWARFHPWNGHLFGSRDVCDRLTFANAAYLPHGCKDRRKLRFIE